MKIVALKLLGLALIMSFLIINEISAQNGTVSGKIVDSSTGEALPGANIIVEGTNYGTSSDRFGLYRINKLPFGKYTIVVSYIGYEETKTSLEVSSEKRFLEVNISIDITAVKMEDVVVSGLREGQSKALNQQKNSLRIQNILSKEEIAKFPDMNTAEVLERVSGVYVSRSQGEGQYVYIRGTDPRLTSITVDGQKLASDNRRNRVVDVGVINASQLASIEVTKVLTPDLKANGVGGQVNIVTKSPFDYAKPILSLESGAGYAIQGKNPLYRFAATYSGFLDENKNFGFLVNGNFYQNTINGQNLSIGYGEIYSIKKEKIPFAVNNFFLENVLTIRNRYGASASIEYRPNNVNSYYLRGMYNLQTEDYTRSQMYYRLGEGRYYTLNPTEISPGVVSVDSFLVIQSRMDYSMYNEQTNSTLISTSLGGKNLFGSLELDYNLSFSSGKQVREDPPRLRSEWAIMSRPNFRIGITDSDYPKIDIINDVDILDPSNYQTDSQEWKAYTTSNTNFNGGINSKLSYNFLNIQSELKTGASINIDKKDQEGWTLRYEWSGGDNPLMDLVSTDESIDDFLDNRYEFGPFIDVDKANQLIEDNNNPGPGEPGLTHLGSESEYASSDALGGNYKNKENLYSFYLMNTFKLNDFTIIAGLRDEYTDTKYEGIKIITDLQGLFSGIVPNISENNYNNIFYHLHLKYKMSQLTNVRAAFTQTIARPNYYDLVPYDYISADANELIQGNPNLKPTLSTNLDFMVDHYFQGIGVASIGAFYKDIENIIYERSWLQFGGQYDGFRRVQPVNFGKSKLYGFEVNWQQQFTFLPGLFNGFGIYANYTYTKSEADLEFRDWDAIPGQAGNVGNLGLTYEKYGVTLRISGYYHSKVLTSIGDTPEYDVYQDENIRLDIASIYEIFDGFSFFLNLRNITNTRDRSYMGDQNRTRRLAFYGMSLDSGIKYNL